MVEVIYSDIDAACSFLESWEPGPELTQDKLAVAFARHRIAARDAALEEAAKVVEKWIEPVMATPHENATYRSIATAIRALRARIAELEADRAEWVGEREESIRRGARRTPGRFRL